MTEEPSQEEPTDSDQEEPSTDSLVVRFLKQMRELSLGDRDSLDLPPDTISKIAKDLALRNELRAQLTSFSQDPDFPMVVIDQLKLYRIRVKEVCETHSSNVRVLDTYGLRMTSGAALGGGAALLYGSVVAGSLPFMGTAILTGVGLAGLAGCLYTRTKVTKAELKQQSIGSSLDELIDQLVKIQENDND